MNRFLKFILSRTFLFGTLILLQVALFIALFVVLDTGSSPLYVVFNVFIVLLMLILLERADTNPAYKMMWLFFVVTMPVSGAVFYLLWGSRGLRPKKVTQFAQIEERANAALPSDDGLVKQLCNENKTASRSVQYLSDVAFSPVYQNTQCRYFPMGEDFFPVFLQQLRAAKHSIFMEYFIVDDSGSMWEETFQILKEKARAGVDVRIIYDAFGSMFTLPSDYDEQLRHDGIKCYAFNALHFSWHLTDYKMLNHRDHRKITVIDNEIAFSGGLNFADEYINRKQRFGVWKDTSFMLQGAAVYSLSVTFLRMWDFVAGTKTDFADYLPQSELSVQDGYVQPYCDSPFNGESIAENAYFNIIHSAQEYVYIVSPYLILDNEMVTSLCLAAKSGVDVRIITPGIPDKWYVYYVTQSYYPQLIEAGVRIYEYAPGFIHAKMYLSDDKLAIVGSANMDYRSFYLHFENCCAFYGGQMIRDIKNDILKTLSQCREISYQDTLEVPSYQWLVRIFLRLLAPLM